MGSYLDSAAQILDPLLYVLQTVSVFYLSGIEAPTVIAEIEPETFTLNPEFNPCLSAVGMGYYICHTFLEYQEHLTAQVSAHFNLLPGAGCFQMKLDVARGKDVASEFTHAPAQFAQ